MKKTNNINYSTSFHNVTIKTTINELVRVLGEPTIQDNTGKDKTNFEWDCLNKNGKLVTIYDWKEYRSLDADEVIEFHLGSQNPIDGIEGKLELVELLKK
jgi:hypothetical protein